MNKSESIRVDIFSERLITGLLVLVLLGTLAYFWGELRTAHSELIQRRDNQVVNTDIAR